MSLENGEYPGNYQHQSGGRAVKTGEPAVLGAKQGILRASL